MSKTTPATQALTKTGVAFAVKTYDFHPGGERIALKAAAAVDEAPARVLKTLMVTVDGKPACAVIASDKELSMKKVAAAFKGKSADMMAPKDAERMSGYHCGGISPFGQRKKVRTVFDAAVVSEPYLIINGGGRGVMVQIAPADAIEAVGAATADITS
jgi:Cys-tRNA(Pro)/Cys-tRNA(Cys) deacylase